MRGRGGFSRGGDGGGSSGGFKRPREGGAGGFRGRGGMRSELGGFSRGRGGSDGGSRGGGFGRGFSRGGGNALSGGYRPQVTEDSVPSARPRFSQDSALSSYSRGRGGGFSSHSHASRPSSSSGAQRKKQGRDVVVILEKAGLLLGNMGLVDAYDRAATTEIANESLKDVRPDIVHQCLLALFDSDLAYHHHLRVYINIFARTGKVIEISPALRPPRTYGRFRGLMSVLLRDGRVCSADGQVLMRLLPGSIAPIIPHGAEVVGLTNQLSAPVVTPTKLTQHAVENPVDDALQGGIKNVAAFYCVSCTDECDMDGVDYVTKNVCLSAYPMSSHVMCARICEGHSRVSSETAPKASEMASPE